MVNFLTRYYRELKNLAILRYERIEKYLKVLEENYEITDERDKESAIEIRKIIDDRVKRLKRIYTINFFLYLGIYFSFVSIILTEFAILQQVSAVIKGVISIFGTSVFIAGLYITSRLKELYHEDLSLLSAHLIAIHNDNKFTGDQLFKDENKYSTFLEFFKKRGF